MTTTDKKLKKIFDDLKNCHNEVSDDSLVEYLKSKNVQQNDILFMKHELLSLITTCMMRIDYVDKKIK